MMFAASINAFIITYLTGAQPWLCSGLQLSPVSDLASTSARQAYATHFQGCAAESCGCGLPPELLKDGDGNAIPYVALNVQNTGLLDLKLPRPLAKDDSRMGMFNNGKNCGRWVEITLKSNCFGHGHDSYTDPPNICGANAYEEDPASNYRVDDMSGSKAYAVVADSCQDNNYWCAAFP
jgi:hypothetical protein